MVKKDTFFKEFPQNAKNFHPGSFPEAVVWRFSVKEVFLRISQNPQFIFNKVGVLQSAILFKKETPAQAFPCEFCKILKNVFITEKLWATAWFFTISREVSHYAILSVDSLLKH